MFYSIYTKCHLTDTIGNGYGNGSVRLNGLVVRAIEETETKAVILKEAKGKSRYLKCILNDNNDSLNLN